jgi:hypothetical protein
MRRNQRKKNGNQVEKKEEKEVVEEQEVQKKVNEQETKSQKEKEAAIEPKTPSKPPQINGNPEIHIGLGMVILLWCLQNSW